MKPTNISSEQGHVARVIGAYVLWSINTILSLVCSVGILWIKANVPSKQDFDEFQAQVRKLELSVVSLHQTQDRINDFESRIRELEKKTRIAR